MVSLRHLTASLFSLLNIGLVATSMIDVSNQYAYPSSYLQQLLQRSAIRRQGTGPFAAQGLVDYIMYGLAGIPVYKAVETLLPLFKMKKLESRDNGRVINSRDNGRVINSRHKRDLAYAQQLLGLLISVETALEKYGITEPQCQLRSTCEMFQRNAYKLTKNAGFEKNVIKLVNEMRREIKNPKVIPLAKYVFEYYEEAAERGEQNKDCKALYNRCPYSLDNFYKRTKGTKTRFPPFPGYESQQLYY